MKTLNDLFHYNETFQQSYAQIQDTQKKISTICSLNLLNILK